MSVPADKMEKKQQNMQVQNNRSGVNQGGASYAPNHSQNISKGSNRGNMQGKNIVYEKREPKKEDGHQIEETQSQQRNHGTGGGNRYKDSRDNNNGGSNTKKIGLGKNKFYQIYQEIEQSRKNGRDLLNQDWLKELNTQFPQIFVREHLAPIFMDKKYCDKFNPSDAFERHEKKHAAFNPSNNNHNQDPITNFVKIISEPNVTKQQFHDQKSESSDEPNWEVNDNDFDFEFKTFDKEKYALEMKNQVQKNNATKTQTGVRQPQQQYNNQQQRPAQTIPKNNTQTSQNQSNSQQNSGAPTNVKDNANSFSGMQFFSILNNKTENEQPAISELDREYELEYEDIDQKLENLAKEKNSQQNNNKIMDFFLEQVQNNNGKNDSTQEQSINQNPTVFEQSRQIHVHTLVQNEFQDVEDEDDDEDNDETFNVIPEKESVQAFNTNLSNDSTNKFVKTDQETLQKDSYQSLLSKETQNQSKSSKFGFAIGQQQNQMTQDYFKQTYDQQYNYQIQQQEEKKVVPQYDIKPSFAMNAYANIGYQQKDNMFEDDNSSEYGQEEDDEEDIKQQMLAEINEGQLEELVVNQDDAEDIKEKVYEALFQPQNEQEMREQEERKREKERKNNEKIAEIMAYQEEGKNNFFQSIAYLLQVNPRESIWIYKDEQGIQQGPFNSLQMDSYKDHFTFFNHEISYYRVLYWIQYKSLSLYSKLYATRIKEFLQKESATLQYQQQNDIKYAQNTSTQQKQVMKNNMGGINQTQEVNPLIQNQMLQLQMQLLNSKHQDQIYIQQPNNINKPNTDLQYSDQMSKQQYFQMQQFANQNQIMNQNNPAYQQKFQNIQKKQGLQMNQYLQQNQYQLNPHQMQQQLQMMKNNNHQQQQQYQDQQQQQYQLWQMQQQKQQMLINQSKIQKTKQQGNKQNGHNRNNTSSHQNSSNTYQNNSNTYQNNSNTYQNNINIHQNNNNSIENIQMNNNRKISNNNRSNKTQQINEHDFPTLQ